jgi:uncharacterized membrane protein YgcG
MRDKILEIFCRFAFLIAILLAFQAGAAIDYPEFVGYVNDYAHLLSTPETSALNQELSDFDNRTSIEFAVVTVNSIGSETPQDYAINLANSWGVGKQDKNNGIIFLVAMESRDIWIETGPGLSGQISDQQIQQVVDDVIIPQFRENRPDLGIIDGVHSIISHFESASTRKTGPVTKPLSSPAQNQNIGNPNFLRYATSWFLAIFLALLLTLGIIGWFKAKNNKLKIKDLRKRFDELVNKEVIAIEALKELKANYVQSVWKSSEEAFNRIDHERLELDLLNAERSSNRGLISIRAVQSQINNLEIGFQTAQKNIDVPINKLAEAKRAQQECAAILAGLGAAFSQAEKEIVGDQISMATRMNLETASHIHQEALSISAQPANAIDWIALLERLVKLKRDVEQVSKDAVRDRAIAAKVYGQDPDELLAKMEEDLDKAERDLKNYNESRSDLEAARAEYNRAQEYHSGRRNIIDLYLIHTSIKSNIERGHEHHIKAMEEARHREETWGSSSGAGTFGGGHMGGGSHGGGSWGGGSQGGGHWGGGHSRGHSGGRMGGGRGGGGKF